MARKTRRYKRAWEYPHTPGDLDGCEKKGVAGKGIRTARRSGQANMKATCGGKQTAGGGVAGSGNGGTAILGCLRKSGKQRTYRTTFLRLGATESARDGTRRSGLQTALQWSEKTGLEVC